MKVTIYQCSPTYHIFPLVSWLIKCFQKTNYSHYAIGFDSIVVDATGENVLPHLKFEFFTRYKIINSFTVDTDADFKQLIYWSLVHVKKEYGFMQIFGLLLMSLGWIKNNPFGKDEKKLICNELILYFLQEFCGAEFKDTDSFDLVKTEAIIRRYAKQQNVL